MCIKRKKYERVENSQSYFAQLILFYRFYNHAAGSYIYFI